jgi:hypothetical protein
MPVASDDLRNRNVAAYNESYKEAQRHTEGNRKGSSFLYVIESEMMRSVKELRSPT